MNEQTYGDIICKYPELIENGLTLKGREVNVYGRRIDLLFTDEKNRKLIVELKVVPINDTHVGQILDYYSALKEEGCRLMLVSPKIPLIKINTLDNIGISWKVLTFETIREFLIYLNDNTWDSIFNPIPPEHNNELIITPYENEIEYQNQFARISIYDRNRNGRNLIYDRGQNHQVDCMTFQTTAVDARLYQIIETILKDNGFLFSTNLDDNYCNWGFCRTYRQNGQTATEYGTHLIWIGFMGRNPKRLRFEIHNRYLYYFNSTNFQPVKLQNGYLKIENNINENNINELMDILVNIRY